MRAIKFRGRDYDTWYYGDLEYSKGLNRAMIHTYTNDGFYLGQHQIDPDTVGQFTGLHDKNGKEVYEGDIVEWGNLMGTKIHSQIIYDERKFSFGDVKGDSEDIWCINSEVIGNIHDNPELMKEE